jgi:type II secretory pathway component GspD/PulD (secretin)
VTVRLFVPVVIGSWLAIAAGQASVGTLAEVRLASGRVHIQAAAAPVADVLDRFSRATGMKVLYEGTPPGDRVTVAIDAGSETEALSRLFEGLGLTYALKLSADGRRVETLFVTNAPARREASGASHSTPPRPIQMAMEDYENGTTIEDEPMNEPGATSSSTSEGNIIIGGSSDFGGQQGVPGHIGGTGQPGGVGVQGQDPNFPGPASFPAPPVNPGFPAFPGPVSYP